MQKDFNPWIVLGLIAFLSIVTYANAMRGDFVWDDWNLVANNYHIKSWNNLRQNLASDFFQRSLNKKEQAGQKLGYYRPVITLTFMLDYSLTGENPLGYHITNVIWHTACGILIYFFILLLLGNSNLALLTSLLFTIHPVHAESVAWISGRTDIVYCFFFILSLYLYSRGYVVITERVYAKATPIPLTPTLSPSRGEGVKKLYPVLSLAAFILALFAKETAVILPLVLIIIDSIFIVPELNIPNLRKRIKAWIPYWITLIIYLITRFGINRVAIGTETNIALIGKYYILLTFCRAILYYLYKLIYPATLNPYILLGLVTRIFSVDVILAVSIFTGSLFLAYFMREKNKGIAFAILFFWTSLIPLSNIVPIRAPADCIFPAALRYLYLPSLAYCLLAAILLEKLSALKIKKISAGTLILGLLMVFYIGGTIYANTFWWNDIVLYRRILELSPNSPTINGWLANSYFYLHDYDNAIQHYNKSIELKDYLGPAVNRPQSLGKSHTSLSRCYFLKGDIKMAIAEAKIALNYYNRNAETHILLSTYYKAAGEIFLADQERATAIKLNGSYANATKNN